MTPCDREISPGGRTRCYDVGRRPSERRHEYCAPLLRNQADRVLLQGMSSSGASSSLLCTVYSVIRTPYLRPQATDYRGAQSAAIFPTTRTWGFRQESRMACDDERGAEEGFAMPCLLACSLHVLAHSCCIRNHNLPCRIFCMCLRAA